MKNINTYDIVCLALKSAPRYIEDADLLTTLISRELEGKNWIDPTGVETVRNIVWLALRAARSGDFRANAEKLLQEFEKNLHPPTFIK